MATSSVIPTVYSRPRHQARSPTPQLGRSKKRSRRSCGARFIDGGFLPIVSSEHGSIAVIGRQFYRSLHLLCEHYQLTSILPIREDAAELTGLLERVSAILEKEHRVDTMVIAEENGRICLATAEVLDTGRTLYYLPVRPMWQLSRNPDQAELGELVLAIYAWFFHQHNLPGFSRPGYVDSQYHVMENWAEEIEDEEERKEQFEALALISARQTEVFRLIETPFHISRLQNAIHAYRSSKEPKRQMLDIAEEVLRLHESYPDRSLLTDIRIDLRYPLEEYRIYPDQYISFYWSGCDQFTDMLIEMVSTDLQEHGIIDEPAHYKLFNGKPVTEAGFDFEKRMLSLICDLHEFLDLYDYEEYHPPTGPDL